MMIELYTAATFNGWRASIMLEETGLPYISHRVELALKEQKWPDFLKLNPSGRIPVLVDHDGTGEHFILTQSVAIVQYLAEKTGCLLPVAPTERAKVYEWMQFHAVDIGSSLFLVFYLKRLCSPRQFEAAKFVGKRTLDLYSHFDDQLAKQEYLAGSEYSIADVIAFPAALSQEQQLANYPHLSRWIAQLKQRPAVQRGMAVPERESTNES
ncbi:MAG: glutathione S-transferase family protein [Gammaproteobacteria bacterium]